MSRHVNHPAGPSSYRLKTGLRLAALLSPLVLASCVGGDLLSGGPQTSGPDPQQATISPSFSQFSDVPIPPRAKMDLDKTLILGAESGWIGRLSLSTPLGLEALYDFYQQELPGLGWEEVTVVRASTSILTYVRQGRVATITLTENTLTGSTVDFTVSPRGTTLGSVSS